MLVPWQGRGGTESSKYRDLASHGVSRAGWDHRWMLRLREPDRRRIRYPDFATPEGRAPRQPTHDDSMEERSTERKDPRPRSGAEGGKRALWGRKRFPTRSRCHQIRPRQGSSVIFLELPETPAQVPIPARVAYADLRPGPAIPASLPFGARAAATLARDGLGFMGLACMPAPSFRNRIRLARVG